jgi:hypothetical protein
VSVHACGCALPEHTETALVFNGTCVPCAFV